MVTAFLPWFGAKRMQAQSIVPHLGEHQSYWDIFCGSLALLWAKPQSRSEVVNDLHGGLINLLRLVQDEGTAIRLYARLERTLFCKPIYLESTQWLATYAVEREELVRAGASPCPEWAYHYFVASWMGRNGLSGTEAEYRSGFAIRYTTPGGDPAVRFRAAVSNIPRWYERLKRTTVLQEDGIALAEKIGDQSGTSVYVDPPYLKEGWQYRHGFSAKQHEHLATVLRRFRSARVVVSYYEDPLLEHLYLRHGWRLVRQKVDRKMGGGDRGKAPEVLLLNPVASYLSNS